jgi:hypothetical protein
MASIKNISQDIDCVTVVEDTDDSVQILGITCCDDGESEIEGSLVEIDGTDSIFVDVEDFGGYEDVNEFDSYNDGSLNDDYLM